MARAAVEGEIARLDALSRTRALTDRESARLARLITVDRRYAYGRSERTKSRPAPCKAVAGTIVQRLDATLASMGNEGLSVRAIYLVPDDLAELAATCRSTDEYAGHAVRRAKGGAPSRVYSKHGVARAVRKVRAS